MGKDKPLEHKTTVSNELLRNQVLAKVVKKIIPRRDVCDAHNELLRLATNYGEEVIRLCPVCLMDGTKEFLYIVQYAFSSKILKSALPSWHGRSIVSSKELKELSSKNKNIKLYTVEVCLVCKWNFMLSYRIL